jgi:hypothetical protein
MWVRSQDGQSLIKCEAIFKVSNVEKLKLYGVTGGEEFFLGEYSTKERAIEVMNEIQQFVVDVIRCKDDKMFYPVYIMPEK